MRTMGTRVEVQIPQALCYRRPAERTDMRQHVIVCHKASAREHLEIIELRRM